MLNLDQFVKSLKFPLLYSVHLLIITIVPWVLFAHSCLVVVQARVHSQFQHLNVGASVLISEVGWVVLSQVRLKDLLLDRLRLKFIEV